MGSWGGEEVWLHCSWQTGWVRQWLADRVVPHFCADKTRRNNGGARQTKQPRDPAQGNKASKPLTEKICGG